MNKKIKNILFLSLIFIIVCFIIKVVLDKTYLSSYNRDNLSGANRYESMVKISNERWKKSKEAVLLNIHSISDSVSAAPFAYQKDIPMFFSESYEIDNTIKKELKRLGLEKIYIIGGLDSIDKRVEKQINKMGIETERIFGNGAFETSMELAKRVAKLTDVKELAIVNINEGKPNGVAMASPASKNSMPIIMMNKKGRKEVLDFVNENDIQKTYFIGNEEQFSDEFLEMIPNSKRIKGKNRYDTSIKIIKEFYDLDKINKVYMTKAGEDNKIDFINTLSLSTVAAKQGIPILFNNRSLGKQQKQFLAEINVKNITEVGFELMRPKIINPQTTKIISCLAIVGIWTLGIRRVI